MRLFATAEDLKNNRNSVTITHSLGGFEDAALWAIEILVDEDSESKAEVSQ